MKACEFCQFYSSRTGECRRYAPRAQIRSMLTEQDLGDESERVWPFVYHFDWCGEFELRPALRNEVPDE